MILHTRTVVMSNASYTHSRTLTHSTLAEQPSHLNAECADVCNCAWHHSAIRRHTLSARLEDCSFQHIDAGALSREEDSLLTLKQVAFVMEADDTPTRDRSLFPNCQQRELTSHLYCVSHY